MPIVIKRIGKFDAPTIVCYFCGEPIVGRGNAVWANEDVPIVEFVHKRVDSPTCDEDRDIYVNSMEVWEFMKFAATNFAGAEGEK